MLEAIKVSRLNEVRVQLFYFLNGLSPALRVVLRRARAQQRAHVDFLEAKAHCVSREYRLGGKVVPHAVVERVPVRLYELEVANNLSVNAADDSARVCSDDSRIVLVEHLLTVHGDCPWDQFGMWVHNVLNACGVGVDGRVWKALQQKPGAARVVQVNVGDKHLLYVFGTNIMFLQVLQRRRNGERRACFHDRNSVLPANNKHTAETVSLKVRVYPFYG